MENKKIKDKTKDNDFGKCYFFISVKKWIKKLLNKI